MINSGDLQVIADVIGGALTVAAYVAIGAIKGLSTVLGFLRDNMYWLKPLFIAGAVALGVYTAALIAYKVATGLAAMVTKVKAAAEMMSTTATFAATAANTALMPRYLRALLHGLY